MSWRYSKREPSGEAPHFVEPLQPQVASKKQCVKMQCVVQGKPTPEVTWFKKDKEIKPSKTRVINYIPNTGVATLTLHEPTSDDETMYMCRAVNKLGQAESRANLIVGEEVSVHKPVVMVAPRITKPIEAIVAQTSSSVKLDVEFTGTPIPEVKWYRNGKEITPETKGKTVFTNNLTTTLTIPEVARSDIGKYEVRATNEAGEARTAGTVAVVEPQKPQMEDVIPPKFIKQLEPQIIPEGQVTILEAQVQSYPVCSFQWFQDSKPIQSCAELRIATEENKSALIISETYAEFAGQFTCRAENVAGSVAATASVSVVEQAATEELVIPSFVKPLVDLRVMDGEEVHFTCEIAGKPTPRVTWLRNGEPIREASDVTCFQDTEGVCKLAISEVFPEDSGEYSCYVINKVGESVCSASLVVEAYEYIPDSEISVTMGTSLTAGQSGSEEDLLAEKTLSEVSEESRQQSITEEPSGMAPYFTSSLALQPLEDGRTRFEVKVDGKPKPEVHWYKQGVEIIPCEAYQVEELDDGTWILTIDELPETLGEVVCVAQNPLGVTSEQILLTEEYVQTKEYRKPEWVTRMEELQEQLRGTISEMSTDEHANRSLSVMSMDSLECSESPKCMSLTQNFEPRPFLSTTSFSSLDDVKAADDAFFNTTISCPELLFTDDIEPKIIPFRLNEPDSQDEDDNVLKNSQILDTTQAYEVSNNVYTHMEHLNIPGSSDLKKYDSNFDSQETIKAEDNDQSFEVLNTICDDVTKSSSSNNLHIEFTHDKWEVERCSSESNVAKLSPLENLSKHSTITKIKTQSTEDLGSSVVDDSNLVFDSLNLDYMKQQFDTLENLADISEEGDSVSTVSSSQSSEYITCSEASIQSSGERSSRSRIPIPGRWRHDRSSSQEPRERVPEITDEVKYKTLPLRPKNKSISPSSSSNSLPYYTPLSCTPTSSQILSKIPVFKHTNETFRNCYSTPNSPRTSNMSLSFKYPGPLSPNIETRCFNSTPSSPVLSRKFNPPTYLPLKNTITSEILRTDEKIKSVYHTLPRRSESKLKSSRKIEEVVNKDDCQSDIASTSMRMSVPASALFPLEPRTLELSSLPAQLHTADSLEELQEFLLLESQCTDNVNEKGLASKDFDDDDQDDIGTKARRAMSDH